MYALRVTLAGSQTSFSQTKIHSLAAAVDFLDTVGNFLVNVASVLAAVAMAELGRELFRLRGAAAAVPEAYTRDRRCALTVATLQLVLAIALFARDADIYGVYYRTIDGLDPNVFGPRITAANHKKNAAVHNAYGITTAYIVVMQVAAMGLLYAASVALHRSRGTPQERVGPTVLLYSGIMQTNRLPQPALYCVLAALAWFVRFLWDLVAVCLWRGPHDDGVPQYDTILEPILNSWLFVAALVSLYLAFAGNGMWTSGADATATESGGTKPSELPLTHPTNCARSTRRVCVSKSQDTVGLPVPACPEAGHPVPGQLEKGHPATPST